MNGEVIHGELVSHRGQSHAYYCEPRLIVGWRNGDECGGGGAPVCLTGGPIYSRHAHCKKQMRPELVWRPLVSFCQWEMFFSG